MSEHWISDEMRRALVGKGLRDPEPMNNGTHCFGFRWPVVRHPSVGEVSISYDARYRKVTAWVIRMPFNTSGAVFERIMPGREDSTPPLRRVTADALNAVLADSAISTLLKDLP